jgi:hypothetical protein
MEEMCLGIIQKKKKRVKVIDKIGNISFFIIDNDCLNAKRYFAIFKLALKGNTKLI